MRENLLGYLLGALDGPEHEELEKQLENNPQLHQQLQRLEGHVDVLACSQEEHHPPQGLALRACEMVDCHCRGETDDPDLAMPASLAPSIASASPRWTMSDMLVAAGIFLAAALLFFPAIATSHRQAQVAACQNNLRQLGVALQHFCSNNDDCCYPKIDSEGPQLTAAGLYGPLLVAGSGLNDTNMFMCPADSNLPGDWRMPSLPELRNAKGPALAMMKNNAGGSYAYPLGYIDGGKYRTHQHSKRQHFAILSDAPNPNMPGRQSSHHGGCGQNVLFDDFHIQYVVGCKIKPCGDDLFVNHQGEVAAGLDADDTVLGSSSATPFIQPVSNGKY